MEAELVEAVLVEGVWGPSSWRECGDRAGAGSYQFWVTKVANHYKTYLGFRHRRLVLLFSDKGPITGVIKVGFPP